jgi:hypothetical protein
MRLARASREHFLFVPSSEVGYTKRRIETLLAPLQGEGIMRVASRLVAFVFLGLLLSLPTVGAQNKDKDPDKKDADKEKAKPAEKWLKAGEVTGKVLNVVEAKKSLRVQVTVAKDKTVDIEWQSIDDVKVRMLNPPPKFDDKGRIKRYTRKELQELKGDDKKTPGYPAEFSDLKAGQYVQVSLVQKKGAPRKVKGAETDPTGEYSPHMSLIVIVKDVEP